MKTLRIPGWFAALLLVGTVASCRTLPDADKLPDTPQKANPTVTTAKGTLQKAQAAQLLESQVSLLKLNTEAHPANASSYHF